MANQLVALPNGCSRSQIKVIPKNWNTKKASTSRTWKIYYRFYDPAFKGTKHWGWPIQFKGMNRYGSLIERQTVTKALIENELAKLGQGFNPIHALYFTKTVEETVTVVSPDTPFLDALRLVTPKLDVVEEARQDIERVIRYVGEAAVKLFDTVLHKKFDALPIRQIEARHLVYLFDQCRQDNPKFSAKRENRYKANLSSCFKMLVTLGAIKENPALKIESKKVVVEKRAILTDVEAKLVDQVLYRKDYYFWRYMQIFFHSGSRNNEMLQLKKDHKVNLQRQEFTILQRKGGDFKEQVRPIPSEILHLWQEIWNEAEDGQYLFGRAFRPGPKPSHDDWPSRKWKELVKDLAQPDGTGGLGIDKDWYALKHRRSDMLAEKLSLQHAQLADGHTTAKTTLIYAVNEEERQRAKKLHDIKTVRLPFSRS